VLCWLPLLIAFLVWPANERTLRDRAEQLMKRDDSVAWNDARDRYLLNMLERFPDGQYADWAQEQLDLIEMRNAEERMRRNLRIGREPASEGERKFAEALRYERFGDRVTALDKYKGIVKLLKDEAKDRPFVNLARRQIEMIESNPPSIEELRRFLRTKLTEADKIYAEGDITSARQIWEGIISLYNGNQEMLPIVEQAQARMEKLKSS
jgi:eukaryotic-like serine/threonine-protein kinase